MMNDEINQVYSQLSNVVNRTYSKLASKVLYKSEHGIIVYNKYAIRKVNGTVEVASRTDSSIRKFESSRNALVWAILDHHGKFFESRRVFELDGMISGTKMDCEIQLKLSKKNNAENYFIHITKLQQSREKQRQFIYELDKYITIAQQCQKRGSYNETK